MKRIRSVRGRIGGRLRLMMPEELSGGESEVFRGGGEAGGERPPAKVEVKKEERPWPDFDYPRNDEAKVDDKPGLQDAYLRDGKLVLGDEGPIHDKER